MRPSQQAFQYSPSKRDIDTVLYVYQRRGWATPCVLFDKLSGTLLC